MKMNYFVRTKNFFNGKKDLVQREEKSQLLESTTNLGTPFIHNKRIHVFQFILYTLTTLFRGQQCDSHSCLCIRDFNQWGEGWVFLDK